MSSSSIVSPLANWIKCEKSLSGVDARKLDLDSQVKILGLEVDLLLPSTT